MKEGIERRGRKSLNERKWGVTPNPKTYFYFFSYESKVAGRDIRSRRNAYRRAMALGDRRSGRNLLGCSRRKEGKVPEEKGANDSGFML